jgi:hypothetical protein
MGAIFPMGIIIILVVMHHHFFYLDLPFGFGPFLLLVVIVAKGGQGLAPWGSP